MSSLDLPTHLPVIDLDASARLVGNDEALAKQALSMLSKQLMDEKPKLESYYKGQDWEALSKHIHKLRGGMAYCSVPRASATFEDLQAALRNQPLDTTIISACYAAALRELDALLKAWPT